MPVSSSTEHWIKPDALTINLNHFGDPDYLQVSVLAGAVVMAFKQNVIGYNAAHNYRTWPLDAANTHLETTSAYNVYARLTRSEVNARALVVYDTFLRDIEGREITYAEDGSEVLGDANPDYFFVFLGQISASVNSNGESVQREWNSWLNAGSLQTNQQQNDLYGGFERMFRPHYDDPLNPDKITWIEALTHLGVVGGVTMYANIGDINIPTILDSLPIASTKSKGIASFDSDYFSVSNGAVTLLPENVGLNTEKLKNYLTTNDYAKKSDIPSLEGYATQSWVIGQGYASSSSLASLQNKVHDFLEGSDTDTIINKWKELEAFLSGLSESDNLASILGSKADRTYVDENFVTISGTEDVAGLHNFVNGLKVGGMKISKSQDDVVYLDGNLVVRGGITMYAVDKITVDSILDSLPPASTESKGIASFDESQFEVNDGHVTIKDEAVSTSLEGLTDIEIQSPMNGETIVYNSETNKWENGVIDSDKTFYYEQQTSSAAWVITHNMSKYPSVMVFDSANDEVHGDIEYNDKNKITITFNAAFSGTAILN